MRLGKTKIKFHFTILALIAFIVTRSIFSFGSDYVTGALAGLISSFTLFFIVLIHELAHIKTAELLGFDEPNSITLWGLGGMAVIPNFANSKPQDEFLIALAGPALNIIIATVIFIFSIIFGFSLDPYSLLPSQHVSLLNLAFVSFFWYNIVLGVFNLAPAFPMDGGRILRSVLSMFIDSIKATKISVYIAKVLAIVFAISGIWFFDLLLIILAGLIWFASSAELKFKEGRYS